jgi:hypothetical protein
VLSVDDHHGVVDKESRSRAAGSLGTEPGVWNPPARRPGGGDHQPAEVSETQVVGRPAFSGMATVVWVRAAPRWSATMSWAVPGLPSVRV